MRTSCMYEWNEMKHDENEPHNNNDDADDDVKNRKTRNPFFSLVFNKRNIDNHNRAMFFPFVPYRTIFSGSCIFRFLFVS